MYVKYKERTTKELNMVWTNKMNPHYNELKAIYKKLKNRNQINLKMCQKNYQI